MSIEKTLATQLLENTQTSTMRDYGGVEVFSGVELTPPYNDLFAGRAIYEPIPYGILDHVADSYYNILKFLRDNVPEEWRELLIEVSEKRRKNGAHEPLDLVT